MNPDEHVTLTLDDGTELHGEVREGDPMSTPTPSIPGVDRDDLADAIDGAWRAGKYVAADAALAHIAAHHECPVLPSGTSPTVLRLAAGDVRGMHLGFGGLPRSLPGTLDALADALEGAGCPQAPPACDREHADEWVEVDEDTWHDLPDGVRVRREWTRGRGGGEHAFVHRDDLPDDPRALIARELGPAKADTFLGLLDEHGWTVTRKGEEK